MPDQANEFDEADLNREQKRKRKLELFKEDLDEGYAENLTSDLFDRYCLQNMLRLSAEYNSYTKDITEFILKLSEVYKDEKNITLKEKLITDHRLLMVYWCEIFESGDNRLPFSRKKYTRYMHKQFKIDSKHKYTLYRLISLNFLREEMPEEYEKLTEDSYFSIESIVKELTELQTKDDSKDNNDYDEMMRKYYKYDKKCRRYIKKVFGLYLPDRASARSLNYNCLDYCFLAFLLENMDTQNGQALIRRKALFNGSKKIKDNDLIFLDEYFAEIIRFGLISLVNYHFNYQPLAASKRIVKIKNFFDSTYLMMATNDIDDKIQKIKEIFEIIYDKNIEIPGDECNYIIESLDEIYNILKDILNPKK